MMTASFLKASRTRTPSNSTEYISPDSFLAPLIHMSSFFGNFFQTTAFNEAFSIIAETPSFLKIKGNGSGVCMGKRN